MFRKSVTVESKQTTSLAKIEFSAFKVTPNEIKLALDKHIADEKKTTLNKIKNFFNLNDKPKKYISDPQTPAEKLIKFNSEFTHSEKNVSIGAENIWRLLELAMDPSIKPKTPEYSLFHTIIGSKLDIPFKSNDILTKLRWWNNFYLIKKDDFHDYCQRALNTQNIEEVEKSYRMVPRKKVLSESLFSKAQTEMTSLANDIEKTMSSLVKDLSKELYP